MMNYIWSAIILFSVVSSIVFHTGNQLSSGIISSGNTAVDLCITLLGTFCLWNGLMNIAEKSGLTKLISKFMSPVICRIFKSVNKNSNSLEPICLNITSNLLGLSNAATPIGIEAMKRMSENNKNCNYPTNDMVLFVVLNTAALRIIPTTVAAIRTSNNSENPLEIVLPSILVSLCALTVGIIMAKITERFFKND